MDSPNGNGAHGLVTADFNNDGELKDVVCTNYSSKHAFFYITQHPNPWANYHSCHHYNNGPTTVITSIIISATAMTTSTTIAVLPTITTPCPRVECQGCSEVTTTTISCPEVTCTTLAPSTVVVTDTTSTTMLLIITTALSTSALTSSYDFSNSGDSDTDYILVQLWRVSSIVQLPFVFPGIYVVN